MRHGEKDENQDDKYIYRDVLTERGVLQAHASGKLFAEADVQFAESIYSGSIRTWQTVTIACGAARQTLCPSKIEGFHFKQAFDETLGGEIEKFKADVAKIQEASNGKMTLKTALDISSYARRGRQILTNTIITLASFIYVGKVALCGFSRTILRAGGCPHG